MPLATGAMVRIRACLEAISRGGRPPRIVIGQLTTEQVTSINARRASHRPQLPPISGVVTFVGRHVYERRVIAQQYTIDEVLEQIEGAMNVAAELIDTRRGTLLQNKQGRIDQQGRWVRDVAILECSGSRTGEAELYSVYPEGDGKGSN